MSDISHLRQNYKRAELCEDSALACPIKFFQQWLDEAIAEQVTEPNAMILATVANQQAYQRTVLLKYINEHGFAFFTNYEGRKAQQLNANSLASLLFLWLDLERQVHITGVVTKLSEQESKSYFSQRPRESQLGAWASNQSEVVKNKQQLLDQYQEIEARFQGQEIPKPSSWGGYILHPKTIEFWQGGSGRMHDRLIYEQVTKQDASDESSAWTIKRLSP